MGIVPPIASASCFRVSFSKKRKLNAHNPRNDQSDVNGGHSDSPFPLLSVLWVYYLPGPSGLHSEFLGLIPLVVHDSNPWKGPSMACLPSIPSHCNVMWLFIVPRLNLHLQDVIFFHILLYSPNKCLKVLYRSVFIYLLFFPLRSRFHISLEQQFLELGWITAIQNFS